MTFFSEVYNRAFFAISAVSAHVDPRTALSRQVLLTYTSQDIFIKMYILLIFKYIDTFFKMMYIMYQFEGKMLAEISPTVLNVFSLKVKKCKNIN